MRGICPQPCLRQVICGMPVIRCKRTYQQYEKRFIIKLKLSNLSMFAFGGRVKTSIKILFLVFSVQVLTVCSMPLDLKKIEPRTCDVEIKRAHVFAALSEDESIVEGRADLYLHRLGGGDFWIFSMSKQVVVDNITSGGKMVLYRFFDLSDGTRRVVVRFPAENDFEISISYKIKPQGEESLNVKDLLPLKPSAGCWDIAVFVPVESELKINCIGSEKAVEGDTAMLRCRIGCGG